MFPSLILQHVPSTLKAVTLAFEIDYDGSFIQSWIDCVDWEYLEGTLLSFKNLKAVNVVMSECQSPAPFWDHRIESIPQKRQKMIAEALPKMHTSGILYFPPAS